MQTATAPAARTAETQIATTTTGRKVHLVTFGRLACTSPRAGRIDQVLADVPDSDDPRAALLDTLAAAHVAPTRLCGHCFYATTRAAYARHPKETPMATTPPALSTYTQGSDDAVRDVNAGTIRLDFTGATERYRDGYQTWYERTMDIVVAAQQAERAAR